MAKRDERGSSRAKVGSKLVRFPFSENIVAEWLAKKILFPIFLPFEFVCDANHTATGADFTNSAFLRILLFFSECKFYLVIQKGADSRLCFEVGSKGVSSSY